jgi:hypothetical protein
MPGASPASRRMTGTRADISLVWSTPGRSVR